MTKCKNVLKTKNLGITFGGLKAVSGFNMEVCEKEIIGIIGPNGAGKTTVFNLLSGIYQPTEGNIYICGNLMNGKQSYEYVRQGVSRTFQNIRLFKNMTVIDNVKTAMHSHLTYSMYEAILRKNNFYRLEQEAEKRAANLLSLFNLVDKCNMAAGKLAYGEMRKLEIARAVVTGAKILLLDEPACGMNRTERKELIECIKMIRDKYEIAVILIEHDMNFVTELCERIYVLDYGKIICSGVPRDVMHNKNVIAAYLGEE